MTCYVSSGVLQSAYSLAHKLVSIGHVDQICNCQSETIERNSLSDSSVVRDAWYARGNYTHDL